MKKGILIGTIAALVAVLSVSCSTPVEQEPLPHTQSEIVSESEEVTSEEPDLVVGHMTARVRAFDDNTITIESYQGITYTFSVIGLGIDELILQENAPIEVTYRGALDESLSLQTATLDEVIYKGDTLDSRIDELLEMMSTEQKIAQLLAVSAPQKDVVAAADSGQFGAYVLSNWDLDCTVEELEAQLEQIQAASQIAPLFLVDSTSLSETQQQLMVDTENSGIVFLDTLPTDITVMSCDDMNTVSEALLEGGNLLLCDYEQVEAFEGKHSTSDVLDQAVTKILTWKIELGILD